MLVEGNFSHPPVTISPSETGTLHELNTAAVAILRAVRSSSVVVQFGVDGTSVPCCIFRLRLRIDGRCFRLQSNGGDLLYHVAIIEPLRVSPTEHMTDDTLGLHLISLRPARAAYPLGYEMVMQFVDIMVAILLHERSSDGLATVGCQPVPLLLCLEQIITF